ncbi:ChaN family lipoprotein [Fulvivirgaceae bacterium BMA10]|uniref:ChaN family lipoprotein n=1 Tax=Splendidivirga corallicola TaxID=3051826 RepID=A0ABT8KG94_9BACT|nr:ChaN family lipoprotein [Fulvivirgaceae bacterium BMA10]
MKKTIALASILIFSGFTNYPVKQAYKIFNGKGKASSYKSLLKEAGKADVVLFGELHNNPICHWLQLELTKDLYEEKKNDLKLGAEMFERDDQLLLDEYLNGLVPLKNFEREAKLWNNYKTDYAPLVNFAKEHQLPFIATNIPRRYANLVYRKGFESLEDLPEESRKYIAPLPIAYDPELKGYKSMLEMAGGHGGENLPKAQAIKDATMAWSIHANCERGKSIIHYHGTYHSNNFEGIVWYLKKLEPKLKILTIASVEQDLIEDLNEKNKNLADFVLAVPKSMTKTY